MGKIYLQQISGPIVPEVDTEIVERKGLGHPDTICDAVMERISQALSRAYLERFGSILHHNCDKGLLVAGQVEHRFGGGRVLEPMLLVIGDRATVALGEERVDVGAIAVEAARHWFRDNLRRVDPDRHLRYQVELRPGSEELAALFAQQRGVVGANDTSAAVGYAPLSETEKLVLEAEQYLNSTDFKSRFPESGEDVKVMAVRTGRRVDFIVAMPLLDQYVNSEADYFRRKEAARQALLLHLYGHLKELQEMTINLNTLDRRGGGKAGIYLSVLGTSAEDADSGEVGRGNQVNGLIALNRPRGSEAAAGKNPVSHVGKIYSVLTHLLADRLYSQVAGLKETTVWLCSSIGDPVSRPKMVSVQVHLMPGAKMADVDLPIRKVVAEELERIPELCRRLVEGAYPVC